MLTILFMLVAAGQAVPKCSALIQLDCNPATHPPLSPCKIEKCVFQFFFLGVFERVWDRDYSGCKSKNYNTYVACILIWSN